MIVYRELASVERDLGISLKTLYSVSNHIDSHYREVQIPKKDGSFRTLSVPDELLKHIQRRITERLLDYEPVSRYATAYRLASGIRKNALPHVGKSAVLKLDIRGFFDGVTYSLVKDKVFYPEKYSEPIRILLTILCYRQDVLPQGAPSSPVITNIIMRDFDEAVGAWCAGKGIAYTRYCDDMTFSGELHADEIKSFVSGELAKLGFYLNERKTVVATSCDRQTVTGIVVNKRLNASPEYRRQIRQEIFYCCKFGVDEHLARTGNEASPEKYLHSLLGRVEHVLHISPDDKTFREYKETVVDMLKKYRRTENV